MSKAQWPFKATDVQRAIAAVRKATGLHVTSVTVGPNDITVATDPSAADDKAVDDPWKQTVAELENDRTNHSPKSSKDKPARPR